MIPELVHGHWDHLFPNQILSEMIPSKCFTFKVSTLFALSLAWFLRSKDISDLLRYCVQILAFQIWIKFQLLVPIGPFLSLAALSLISQHFSVQICRNNHIFKPRYIHITLTLQLWDKSQFGCLSDHPFRQPCTLSSNSCAQYCKNNLNLPSVFYRTYCTDICEGFGLF